LTYYLSAYHGAYAMLCPNLGNECSRGLQVPNPWIKLFLTDHVMIRGVNGLNIASCIYDVTQL